MKVARVLTFQTQDALSLLKVRIVTQKSYFLRRGILEDIMNEWDAKINLCIIILITLIKIIITYTLNHNHLYLLIKLIVTHTNTTTILHKIDAMLFVHEQCINYKSSIEITAASSKVCLSLFFMIDACFTFQRNKTFPFQDNSFIQNKSISKQKYHQILARNSK